MTDRNREHLNDMLEAALFCVKYVKEHDNKKLKQDQFATLALAKVIEIIGEAATLVSHDYHAKYTAIHWNHIIAMRNIFIHGGLNIDSDQVWQTLKEDIPSLVRELRKILS